MLKFDINLLWVFINLIIFFVFMKLVLFKPIKRTLDKRQELIDKQLKDAAETNAEADAKLADYESKIANAEEEKKQIISDAKDSAKLEYDKIIERAQNDAKQLKAEADARIEADCENAKRAAREDIAELAMQAAQKVVGENVSLETDSAIFDEFLNESSED